MGTPDRKKQEYYRKNRESRLGYQNARYEIVKHQRERKRELLELLDPDELEKEKEWRKNYNARYYEKNRDRIVRRRKQRREAQKRS